MLGRFTQCLFQQILHPNAYLTDGLVRGLLNSQPFLGRTGFVAVARSCRAVAGCRAVPKGKLPKIQSRQDSYAEDAEKGADQVVKDHGL